MYKIIDSIFLAIIYLVGYILFFACWISIFNFLIKTLVGIGFIINLYLSLYLYDYAVFKKNCWGYKKLFFAVIIIYVSYEVLGSRNFINT